MLIIYNINRIIQKKINKKKLIIKKILKKDFIGKKIQQKLINFLNLKISEIYNKMKI